MPHLMLRAAAVADAAASLPNEGRLFRFRSELHDLVQLVADSVRAADVGRRRYCRSRAAAATLALWAAIKDRQDLPALRTALLDLHTALNQNGHTDGPAMVA